MTITEESLFDSSNHTTTSAIRRARATAVAERIEKIDFTLRVLQKHSTNLTTTSIEEGTL